MQPGETIERIPSSDENKKTFEALGDLLGASATALTHGRVAAAPVAVLIGNGLSQIFPPDFKKQIRDLNRSLRKEHIDHGAHCEEINFIAERAWTEIERFRLATWSGLPLFPENHVLLSQWIASGLVQTVFSSNYDLYLESLLLGMPDALPGARRPWIRNSPMAGASRETASLDVHQPLPPAPGRPPTALDLYKYNGSWTHAYFVGNDSYMRIRLGHQEVPWPEVGAGQGLATRELQRRLERSRARCEAPHAWDSQSVAVIRLAHHFDVMHGSLLFQLHRTAARAALDRLAPNLCGFVILGNWGQEGETLNDRLLALADRKPVIQVLWYPPSEEDYSHKRNRNKNLWALLPTKAHGHRMLLLRDHFRALAADAGFTGSSETPVSLTRKQLLARYGEVLDISKLNPLAPFTIDEVIDALTNSHRWQYGLSPDEVDTSDVQGYEALIEILDQTDKDVIP